MPRKSKKVSTSLDRSAEQQRDYGPPQSLGESQPAKIDHTAYVREGYKLDAPKAVVYFRGWTNFEYRIGTARDEHAWTAALEYSDHSTPQSALQLAALYLRPDVPKREARRALDKIFKAFPPKKPSPRPGLYPIERQVLRAAFEELDNSGDKGVTPKMLVTWTSKIYALFAKHWGREILSIKSIEKECRQWRRETGRPTRYYVTKSTDRRPDR